TELDMDTVIGFLQDKVQEGTIRYYGISFRTPGDALSVINDYPLDAIQINYNLIDQRAKEIGLLDRCLEKGIAVIVRTPLCFGFLTGRFTGEEIFTPPDHRSNWPREQIRRWARSAQLFTPLVESYHRTLPQLALAFCTDHAAVTTVIPGMMNPIEVRENVGTIQNIVLTDKDRRFIRDVYHNHIFFDPSIQSKITAKTVNIREGVA
ncbi:MAG: aldo/keto reductase, partial [Fidelibacterota bacterium]